MARIRIKKRNKSSTGGVPKPVKVANAPPKPVVTRTDEGVKVNPQTNDPVLQELALQRVQKQEELAQEKEARASRREQARKAADLQRRAQAIQIEQREANVGREISRLNREGRRTRAGILAQASSGNVTNTSAFRASRVAVRSNVQRETGEINADQARNRLLDQIRSEEIEANLTSSIASNQDPVNVFLDREDDSVQDKVQTTKKRILFRSSLSKPGDRDYEGSSVGSRLL